ncbi:MAG: hypothetical protein AAGU19_16220 [Prolixibacteraceae bacterium]
MKNIKTYRLLLPFLLAAPGVTGVFDCAAQNRLMPYWNSNLQINPYRLPFPAGNQVPEQIDLDGDGDPDVLRSFANDVPVQWIDDDDDMKAGDREGDTDSDCLMIDRNKDGEYGRYGDLAIDWNDTDEDGNADMQVVVDQAEKGKAGSWYGGHYMWVLDTDQDNIFNYIDWNTMKLRCWIHDGQSDFFEDYHGKSTFLKVHSTPEKLNDSRLNWENPFLFYDPDHDNLTEMAVRLLDEFPRYQDTSRFMVPFSGKMTYASLAWDLDNDNAPGNEFDFDFTLGFNDGGFDYTDQIHRFKNMRGLPEADQYFMDPRWRQLSELIYPDHESAVDLIFKRGKWKSARMVYDEDDDCARWERVEFYDPLNPFKTGPGNKGPDDNRQADESGDRAEWDQDNSGNGQLYISRFDGRIHLYGAEWGIWRVDQNAWSYQGMGGFADGYGPGRLQKSSVKFATIRYSDRDRNGFIDEIQYDLDGDTLYESRVDLKAMGVDDRCMTINISCMDYSGISRLYEQLAGNMWKNAEKALEVAESKNLQTSWYALLKHPKSARQQYHHGWWLQFYIFNDLIDQAKRTGKPDEVEKIMKAYYSGQWKLLF